LQTIIKDLQVGDGNKVTHKSRVKVAYKAWIYAPSQIANKGTFLFEAQMDRPMEFTLGDNRAIKGLEKGLINMKVSGKRELIIPAAEAYGDVGDGDKIPPGAILLFEVQLLEASEV
jgi:FKBP-type peptidyl-prolyl cis-trans isomerase FkpA